MTKKHKKDGIYLPKDGAKALLEAAKPLIKTEQMKRQDREAEKIIAKAKRLGRLQ